MRAWGFLIPLLFVCSCARVPKKDMQASLRESVDLEGSEEEAATSAAFTVGNWPGSDWWSFFDDPQLDALMEQSLENNPSLLSAQAKVVQMLAEARSVKSALFPQVGFAAFDNWEHLSKDSLDRFPPSQVPAVINQIDITLNMSYEFDFWRKNRNRFEAALSLARSTAAEMAETKLLVSTFLASSYFNLYYLLEEQALSDLILMARTLQWELHTLRFENGIDDREEVLSARAAMLEAEEQVIAFDEQIKLMRHQIKVLLGESPDSSEKVKDPTGSFRRPFQLPSDLSTGLLSRRPDLRAKIWMVEAAAREIGVARAAFYPDISLLSSVGLETLSISKLFSADSYKGFLNPIFRLPLFTGGRLRANLDARVAAYEAAIYEYNETLLVAAQQVSDQITLLDGIARRASLQEESANATFDSYELSSMRFEQGIANRLDLLASEETALQERLGAVQLEQARMATIINLIKALGGGYDAQ